MKTDKKVVTIVRSKWARGEYSSPASQGESNSLRNNDGTQCCLGFVCRALGTKVADMKTIMFPSGLADVVPEWLNDIEDNAALVNDDRNITGREREKQLHALFANTPIALKFVP